MKQVHFAGYSLLRRGELGVEREDRERLLQDNIRVRTDDLGNLHLHAHFVVLGVGLGALVLGVRTAALAAAMIEDGDDGRLAGLVHRHAHAAGARAEAWLEGGARGEGGGRGNNRSESNELGGHLVDLGDQKFGLLWKRNL